MITVLMPTYNAAGTILRTIRSILEQTFTAFELLIVDDGSTDDTMEVIRSFDDRRIRVIRTDHGGISRALNAGLTAAAFGIIARIDAGDIALPERLEVQYSLLQQGGRGSIVGCWYAMFRGHTLQYLVRGATEHKEIRRRLALHPDLPHPGILYYKEDILHAGGYREVPLEDYDLWLRVKDVCRFHSVPACLMLIEHAPDSLTNADVRQRYRSHYRLQDPYYRDLDREFGPMDVREQERLRIWREYFYGSQRAARILWRSSVFAATVRPALWIALLTTFLPEGMFTAFKESRWRQRLQYLLHFFGPEERRVRKQLRSAFAAGKGMTQ